MYISRAEGQITSKFVYEIPGISRISKISVKDSKDSSDSWKIPKDS